MVVLGRAGQGWCRGELGQMLCLASCTCPPYTPRPHMYAPLLTPAPVWSPAADGPLEEVFTVLGTYDPSKPGKVKPAAAAGKDKGEGKGAKAGSSKEAAEPMEVDGQEGAGAAGGVAMRSLDIFAGCGGLSEGMHQAGVAETRWVLAAVVVLSTQGQQQCACGWQSHMWPCARHSLPLLPCHVVHVFSSTSACAVPDGPPSLPPPSSAGGPSSTSPPPRRPSSSTTLRPRCSATTATSS